MGFIKRGTTPIHIFETELDLTDCSEMFITYKQFGRILVQKEKKDCDISEDKIETRLTQKETMLFDDDAQVKAEIEAEFPDGSVVRSDIMTACVLETLYEGEL